MLKLNVGFSRKVGEANYGSRGASIHLELELDSGAVGDPERLQQRIREMFELAELSVHEELHSERPGLSCEGNGHSVNAANATAPRATIGHVTLVGNRCATGSQVRALHAISRQQGIDLGTLLRADCGVERPEQLTVAQASELIDQLKGSANGHDGELGKGTRQ